MKQHMASVLASLSGIRKKTHLITEMPIPSFLIIFIIQNFKSRKLRSDENMLY